MNLLGLPPLSQMLLLGSDRPFEMITTPGRNLIPRVINTNIMVYAFNIDVRMPGSSIVIKDSELHKAASCGSPTRTREAVQRNKELLWQKNSVGNLPLHLAVEKGHKDVASLLVKEYPQGSYTLNHSMISPLYLAVKRKDLHLVKSMFHQLKNDENALANLNKGNSIVRVAIGDNNQEMLQSVLEFQPDLIKSTDEEGLTPLSYVAFKGFLDIVDDLLKKFPNSISYRNKDKSNPFHKAGLGGHVQVLEKLYANSKTRKMLLEADGRGRTVLHLAANERQDKLKDVVKYLLSLDEGVVKNLIKKKDENGRTPLDLAKSNTNKACCLLLEPKQG